MEINNLFKNKFYLRFLLEWHTIDKVGVVKWIDIDIN